MPWSAAWPSPAEVSAPSCTGLQRAAGAGESQALAHLWTRSNLHTSLAGGHCNDPVLESRAPRQVACLGHGGKWDAKLDVLNPSPVFLSLLDLQAKSNVPSAAAGTAEWRLFCR